MSEPGPGKPKRTSLMFGNQKINVRPLGADKAEWFTADHVAAGSDDLCFLTSSPPEQVVAHLRACGVRGSKKAPGQDKARVARCGRSIAAIPMGV